MIQIRKEENQKKQKEKKLKVYKVNTHKKTVIALWVLLAMSFLLVSTPDQKKIDFLYPQISLPIIPAIAVY